MLGMYTRLSILSPNSPYSFLYFLILFLLAMFLQPQQAVRILDTLTYDLHQLTNLHRNLDKIHLNDAFSGPLFFLKESTEVPPYPRGLLYTFIPADSHLHTCIVPHLINLLYLLSHLSTVCRNPELLSYTLFWTIIRQLQTLNNC